MENIDFSTLLSKEFYIGKRIEKEYLLNTNKLTERQERFVRIYCEYAELLYKLSKDNCNLKVDESGIDELLIIKVKLKQSDIHKYDMFDLARALQKLIAYNTLFLFQADEKYSFCCSLNHLSKFFDARISDETTFTFGVSADAVVDFFESFNEALCEDEISYDDVYISIFNYIFDFRAFQKSFIRNNNSVFNPFFISKAEVESHISEQDYYYYGILQNYYDKSAELDLYEFEELLQDYCDNYMKENYSIENVNEQGISLFNHIDAIMQFIDCPSYYPSKYDMDDLYIFADWFKRFEFVDDYYHIQDSSLDDEDSDTTRWAEELIYLIQESR